MPAETIGISGFVKRDGLPDADLGFAFLPQYERRGYGFESADAVIRYGREKFSASAACLPSPHRTTTPRAGCLPNSAFRSTD